VSTAIILLRYASSWRARRRSALVSLLNGAHGRIEGSETAAVLTKPVEHPVNWTFRRVGAGVRIFRFSRRGAFLRIFTDTFELICSNH
jgi:hypothetical protein